MYYHLDHSYEAEVNVTSGLSIDWKHCKVLKLEIGTDLKGMLEV